MVNNVNSSLIDDLTKQVGKFSNSINQDIKTNGLVSDAYRADTAQTKQMSAIQKQLSSAIEQTAKSTVGFAKQLQSGGGSFQPLTTVVSMATKAVGGLLGMIPYVGGALKGLAEGLGDVANMMIETYDKTYASFEKLSDSGVVASFDDLKADAGAMSLSMSSASAVLEKRSKEMALFGGSALKGTKMITQLNGESQNLRLEFQKLGVSSTDFLDYQISYMSQQNILNSGKKKNNDDLIQETAEYVKELDATAKLTGQTRKEIMSNREERLKDVQLLAGMKQYAPKAQTEFNGLLDELTTMLGKEVSTAVGGMIVSGGKTNSDMQKAISTAAPELISVAQQANMDLKSGAIDKQEYIKRIRDIMVKVEARTRTLATNMGDATAQTKLYVSIRKAAQYKGADDADRDKKIAAQQDQIIKDKDSQGAQLAETKTAMERAQANIEQLATSSKLVTGLMQKMAEGIEGITEKFYEFTKTEMPAHLKAASEARKATEAEAKIRMQISKDKEVLANKESSWWDKNSAEFSLQYQVKALAEATKKKEQALEKKKQEDIKAGIIAGGATTTDTTGAAAPTTSTAATTTSAPIDPQAVQSNEAINVNGSNRAGSSRPSNLSGAMSLLSFTGASGSRSNFDSMNQNTKDQFLAMVEAYGKPVQINSAKRSSADQERLYNAWRSAGGDYKTRPVVNVPGMGEIRMPVKPGTPDSHIQGRAIDLDNRSYAGMGPLFSKFGFQRVAGDQGHIQLPQARTGGIFSGPDSGYLTELHGDEVVAPVGKQALNTSMLGGLRNNEASDAEYNAAYNELEDKLNRLITIMSDTAKANKKQSMAKFV